MIYPPYDVITGTSKGITFHSTLNEHRDRAILLDLMELRSVVIYDRGYFLARCKKNASKEIQQFYENKDLKKTTTKRYGKPITLLKVKHQGSAWESIFVPSLPDSGHQTKFISQIYGARWAAETAFLELTATLRIEQWHSKNLNGILQELYAALWLTHLTKVCMLLAGEKNSDPTSET